MYFETATIYAILALALLAVLVPASTTYGEVASSTNYQLEFDSVNFGGKYSTSSNYSIEDTAGEVATGRGTSTSYLLDAGYQQNDGTYISITSPADVTLLPAIDGLAGGSATGTAAWTVTTNNTAGYSLSIKAASSSAMTAGSYSFDDYAPAAADPDYTFTIAASVSEFGYTPEGSDIVSRFMDDGASCNTGALDTVAACWDGLSTSDTAIASASSSNHPTGEATTVRFQAEVGSSADQEAGIYEAVVIVTAVAL